MPLRLQENNATAPSSLSGQPQQHEINRNIRLTLLYALIGFAGRSIWSQSVLATYVYLLSDENAQALGSITGVMGMCQFLACIPAGYVADTHRRDFMLKIASAMGLLAIGFTLLQLYAFGNSYSLLVAALAVWGIFWGITNTSLGAIFADSISDGDRSYYFTLRSILLILGNTVGPTMALALFYFLGDNWTMRECAIVMGLGQAVCLPAVLLLVLLNDDDVPSSQDHRRARTATERQPNQTTRNSDLTEPLLPTISLEQPTLNDDLDTTETAQGHENCGGVEHEYSSFCQLEGGVNASIESPDQQHTEFLYCCVPKWRAAAILISMADLTSGIASGMSIRYFPILFLEQLQLSPVQVQVLYLVAPLCQACLMISGQHFSKQYGRCHVTVVHKWIGVSFMLVLVLFVHLDYPAWIICVVYVVRTAFMNSTTPLTKSMLMDNVPANERGRWNILESVNMFSWSGSSFLGGFLVSLLGLLPTFCITASIQLMATLPVIALARAVNVGQDGNVSDDSTASSSSSSEEEQGESTVPSSASGN
ncbi:major Facilitator Superfamily MFS [Seminavis robusta]|uniref:Major Facilitator Superfamily MFS n=1 Tax=Seminavis robusta TaxID=568900 RepID=A0A9N8EWL9_9STRA|nr:major Facilitator Superfamily MFS [Seminavis robusta]|eukprot:Sro2148_g316570.1 major Facilitator Superfamily MFS (537) ;mRNA; f:10291-11901